MERSKTWKKTPSTGSRTTTRPVKSRWSLPAKFPNLLANGTEGIAVGMATKIPPHNLGELCDGFTHLIDHPDATIEDLMQFVKGPDFPTSALILGTKGIRSAYETGRGQVIIQAQSHIETLEGGKAAIIITEIPYQVNKQTLQEKIGVSVREKKVDGITAMYQLLRPPRNKNSDRAAAGRPAKEDSKPLAEAHRTPQDIRCDYACARGQRAEGPQSAAGDAALDRSPRRDHSPAHKV